ncbi:hypothetical protein KP509_13G055300 [Ceratopteris richardii]|uniref:Caffeoyl-CoA O-methyltransferase n=1 Tax=Ceratopteris richardii TaxID=49495 RepID=A0A8T2TFX3_CERRI|nr:hypothetical protein KP509_13G055300 [Ceratopteris richardii]
MHTHPYVRVPSFLLSSAGSIIRRTSSCCDQTCSKIARSSDAPAVVACVSTSVASSPSYGGRRVIRMNQGLYDYLLAHTREDQVLRELREETSTMRGSSMQVSPEQGQLLAMLVRLMGARRCIEVGVFTGYSSLAVAMALPDSGYLVACETDQVSLSIAKKYYERAGVSQKVDIRLGFAIDTLKTLLNNGEGNSYDFAFIDADKRSYNDYYELLLKLVRPSGLIAIDNVLWGGRVADLQVPIGDGLALCRKRDT